MKLRPQEQRREFNAVDPRLILLPMPEAVAEDASVAKNAINKKTSAQHADASMCLDFIVSCDYRLAVMGKVAGTWPPKRGKK